MKKIPVEQAVGMTLCHDITAMRDGFKGAAFRRGHVIEAGDIEKLKDLGKRAVFVWEENAGELHEEDCALRMAAMAPVAGAHYTGPSEGKVVLTADVEGMLRVDADLLRTLNGIGDITISALPDHYPVKPGMRLASMRIVPLVTQEAQIIRAEELCRARPLLRLLPYKPRRTGVIVTGSEVYTGRIQDRFEPVVRRKLAAYPGEILGVTLCDDDADMIIATARAFIDRGADFLIFTGGMSVDPD
ncbi:MAG: molybdopterin-binding protein, partial [Clostridia bacterium]|nr:molybdopterin-binding protein [Clostridia bacterium]